MGLVIFNARYISSKDREAYSKGGMRYGATRLGVETYPTENKNMNEQDFVNYIAGRKGAENYEGEPDGLFNQNGKANLEEEIARLESYSESIEWRTVFSLAKEDAHRVGLYTAQDWQKVLCRIMPRVAQQFNISPQNLVWNAAFHPIDKNGSDHHPHVHIYFYSTDPKEGAAGDEEHTKRVFRRCRSIFTNDVFKEDMEPYKAQKTESKEELRDLVKEFVRQAPSDMLDGVIKALPEKGKKEYGWVNKKAKLETDKVVRKLCSMSGISEAYERLKEAVRNQVEHYFKEPEDIEGEMKDWEENFFHPEGRNNHQYRVLHNAVLREAAARDKNAKEQNTANDILSGISKELKKQMFKEISLSAGANERLPAFQKAFKGLSNSVRHKVINRLTSEAVFDAGNKIHGILKEDPQLAERLIKEVRLDVPMNWNENEYSQMDLLSAETRESIDYYTKVIINGRAADYGALYKLKLRFADIALSRKAEQLVSEYTKDLDLAPLQKLLHCRRPEFNRLSEEGINECARIAAALSDISSEISGSIKANQSEKIFGAIIEEAYKRELNDRIAQIYSDIKDNKEQYSYIAKSEGFKCGLPYSELPDGLKNSVDGISAAYIADTDEYAQKRIRDTVCEIAAGERVRDIMIKDIPLRNHITEMTSQLRVFCDECNITDYSDLPDEKKTAFLNIMRNAFTENREISDYIEQSPEQAGYSLFNGYKSLVYINEQNYRMAHTANTQILGLLSSALLMFRPRRQEAPENNQRQDRTQKRRLKKQRQANYGAEIENRTQDENIEY